MGGRFSGTFLSPPASDNKAQHQAAFWTALAFTPN